MRANAAATRRPPLLDLTGRKALVTGGAKRVGSSVALALAEAGMHVAVSYLHSEDGAEATCAAVRAHGREAHALRADLRDGTAAEGLVDRAAERLGGLDLLVVSAASFEPGSALETDRALWDRTLALNLTSAWLLARRAAPLLEVQKGSMVLLTCTSRLAPYAGYAAYQVSKAALHQLMRVLALELAPAVRVNSVAPGSVLPPDDWDAERLAGLRERIPLRRTGEPRDVADAVLHLARSEWTTGTELVVDGGRSVG